MKRAWMVAMVLAFGVLGCGGGSDSLSSDKNGEVTEAIAALSEACSGSAPLAEQAAAIRTNTKALADIEAEFGSATYTAESGNETPLDEVIRDQVNMLDKQCGLAVDGNDVRNLEDSIQP